MNTGHMQKEEKGVSFWRQFAPTNYVREEGFPDISFDEAICVLKYWSDAKRMHRRVEGKMLQNLIDSVTPLIPKAEKVIVNYPATIVFWSDGTKTIVKCNPADSRNFSVETGVMLCLVKKMLGNTSGALNNTMQEMTEMAELVNVPRREKKAQAPKPKEQTPKPKKKTVYISPDELF